MAFDGTGVLRLADGPGRRRTHAAPGAESTDSGALEVALMRRSLAGASGRIERCGGCERTLLIGERVYEYGPGEVRCALCRSSESGAPADSHTVHGPAFGHSIRVIDRRVPR